MPYHSPMLETQLLVYTPQMLPHRLRKAKGLGRSMRGDSIRTVPTLLQSKEFAPINPNPTCSNPSTPWWRMHRQNFILSLSLLCRTVDSLIPVSWDHFPEALTGYVSSDPFLQLWQCYCELSIPDWSSSLLTPVQRCEAGELHLLPVGHICYHRKPFPSNIGSYMDFSRRQSSVR